MKQKKYETPSVFHTRIKVENSICSASSEVTNPNTTSGRIDEHSINSDFTGDFSSSSWDTDPTK
ncbi:MAG: hypothetical protein ACI399_08270 [Candidatus Cryptobacteroides sp.]